MANCMHSFGWFVRSHFLKPDYISGAWILRLHEFKCQKRFRNRAEATKRRSDEAIELEVSDP